MSMWCDNPRDHRREGERDYERGGRYGYDSQQYHDHWNDCSKYYREGFDEAKREDERRQERLEEQQAEERRHERRIEERRMEERQQIEEEEYYQHQQRQEQQYPPEPTTDDFVRQHLISLGWTRKRRLKWCRLHKVKLNP